MSMTVSGSIAAGFDRGATAVTASVVTALLTATAK
jgi:hypothetical protein